MRLVSLKKSKNNYSAVTTKSTDHHSLSVKSSSVIPNTNIITTVLLLKQAGGFVYHCEIHPWRVATVSVIAATEKGNNFELASGVGPTWNLLKDSRTLLDLTPVTVPLDGSTPARSDQKVIAMCGNGGFLNVQELETAVIEWCGSDLGIWGHCRLYL